MSKGGSSAPAAPDPTVTAQAQATANAEAARLQASLNRVNQITPLGMSAWTSNGDTWTNQISLSPAQQAMLNSQQGLQQTALNTATNQFGRAASSLSTPFSTAGAPSMVSGIDTSGLPSMVGGVNAGAVTNAFADAGPLAREVQTYNLPGLDVGVPELSLNFNGLQQLPGLNDFGGERQRVEDALYARSTSRLDPQWQQQETAMRTRLANQGIAEGSAAYSKAMDDFSRARNDAYSTARNDAILAGGAEQGRLFGQGLAGRQQGVNEVTTAGNFANAAGAQGFGQASQARQQLFGEGLGNTALWNQTQQQAYDQALGRAGFNNTAQAQLFGQGLSNANLQNASRAQLFNEASANATMQNNARSNWIQEQAYLRNLPLQETAALLGMGNVSMPQFGAAPQVGVQAADVTGPVYDSYKGNLAAWQSGQNQAGNMWGNLAGLTGALGSAYLMRSDENAKEGRRPEDPDKLLAALLRMPVERWKYLPEEMPDDQAEHVGPMAQAFREATGLGDGRTIHMADAIGTLIGGVQALARKVDALAGEETGEDEGEGQPAANDDRRLLAAMLRKAA